MRNDNERSLVKTVLGIVGFLIVCVVFWALFGGISQRQAADFMYDTGAISEVIKADIKKEFKDDDATRKSLLEAMNSNHVYQLTDSSGAHIFIFFTEKSLTDTDLDVMMFAYDADGYLVDYGIADLANPGGELRHGGFTD